MQVLLHSSSSSLLPRSIINSSNSSSKLITLSKQLLQGFSHSAGGSSSQVRLKKKQKSSSSAPFCVVFPASATSRETTTAMARGGWASEAATSNASSSEAFSMPQAELCANDAQCVSVEELEGVEGLTQWLRERLISGAEQLKTWGTAPGTKRVANLWTELVDGEISLADARPPKRTVHVASVKIRNESGLYLVESHQEMSDGRIRPRNRPLSEKMRPGENVDDACRRGIFEELGCELGAPERVEMLPESYHRDEQERDSFSYPGLLTQYVLHTMIAVVKHLPATEFSSQEDEGGNHTNGGALVNESGNGNLSAHATAVGVKKHFWKWVTETELAAIMAKF
ncbi:unnamed protein product [Sphagnum troendelagicum]|uniref:Nudix hydrolase domain-containing protein n=1 Tax=Sphagnum troendelagicum TaxID=128251 RepID=A0ABP0UKM3_9BRYO